MKKLLFVDDQSDLRQVLGMVLKDDNRKVLLAKDGEEAIDIAYKEVPDLIILDVMMPGLNGYEVTRILKNNPLTANCAIIILTAKAQQQDREEAFAAGADEYLSKPFKLAHLEKMIEKIFEKQQSHPPH